MAEDTSANLAIVTTDPTPSAIPQLPQAWTWWPLLPLFPYGRRPTLVQEIVPGRIWIFEQLHGVWYVAVPIRMTVVKVGEELLLYAPVPPTGEVIQALRSLETRHGPITAIVLPTASGLEHKLPVPPMARAFPSATVWLTPKQWSFPLNLPNAWLGFPNHRTRLLFEDGLPHPEQLDWIALGPLDLGLGTFLEVACFDRQTGTLLVTDALVTIPSTPPSVFDLDPTPLLFHARERGDEPLEDNPVQRRRGWMRTILFASYLRPESLVVPSWRDWMATAFASGSRSPRVHFGIYPFRWSPGWEDEFERLAGGISVAPVLERLVFPRARGSLVAWIRSLAACPGLVRLITAHHGSSYTLQTSELENLAFRLEHSAWAGDDGSMQTLGRIDRWLVRFGLVPPG